MAVSIVSVKIAKIIMFGRPEVSIGRIFLEIASLLAVLTTLATVVLR